MTTLDERIAQKNKLIPTAGYNVVSVDSFGIDAADEAMVVGHFDTKGEADAARTRMAMKNAGYRYYVYGPDTR